VASFCILHGDVSDAEAIAWLELLPDNETMIKIVLDNIPMMSGHHDHGQYIRFYNYVWLALAHEKVGMYTGALRICELGLETDSTKGATPHSWDSSALHGCKGRVLSKLGRKTDALAAFHAAVLIAKGSMQMVEAIALRELADYCCAEGLIEVEAKTRAALSESFARFGGRISADQFKKVGFRPEAAASTEAPADAEDEIEETF
jgi:hypothetical protein